MDAIKNEPFVYSGRIVAVGETKTFGTKGFAKKDIIVSPNPDDKYPRQVQFFLTKGLKEDRTGLVTTADIGSTVKVSAYVDTRKWESKASGKSGYTTECTVCKLDFINRLKPLTEDVSKPASGSEDITAEPDTGEDLPF